MQKVIVFSVEISLPIILLSMLFLLIRLRNQLHRHPFRMLVLYTLIWFHPFLQAIPIGFLHGANHLLSMVKLWILMRLFISGSSISLRFLLAWVCQSRSLSFLFPRANLRRLSSGFSFPQSLFFLRKSPNRPSS